MNILSIGFDIPGFSDEYNDFKSLISLHDGDLIFFCPLFFYNSIQTYRGKTKYSDTDSYNVKKASRHWKTEIDSALRSGKTIIFILPEYDEFYVDSEKQDTNPSLNVKPINYVEEWSNYKCIQKIDNKFTPTNGLKIKCSNSLFTEFFSQFKDFLSYKVYIESKDLQPVFTTLNGEKNLGGILKNGAGHIIFLPYFDFEQLGFTKDHNDDGYWTDIAIKKGQILVNQFLKITKTLNSNIEITPPPDWVFDEIFTLNAEKKILNDLHENSLLIKQLINNEETLKADLKDITDLKDLLFSSGKQLENAVIKALKILGYQAQNYDDGKLELDQVIISPEGERFIGECEGKDSKDIDISKFRQLIDSLNEDFARDDINDRALGILFGNPERLINPNERTLDFTLKCKSGAAREKIALIKTPDLYKAAKYIIESNDLKFQKKCRETIIQQLGSIVVFPEIPIKRKQKIKT